MERTIVCRDCEHSFEVRAHFSELPLACEKCDSKNTYSELGSACRFSLRPGGVGWAFNGYHANPGEVHINLGAPTAEERAKARKEIDKQKQMSSRFDRWV